MSPAAKFGAADILQIAPIMNVYSPMHEQIYKLFIYATHQHHFRQTSKKFSTFKTKIEKYKSNT
jgi:hypothetical protein